MALYHRGVGRALIIAVLLAGPANAATLKTIYSVSRAIVGAASKAGLLYKNGVAYGTTSGGGTYGEGTVFALDLTTGQGRLLHSFGGGADGGSPVASLIDVGGTLYGTTSGAGASTASTVFSIDPSTGAEKVLCVLAGSSLAALVYDGGLLYGTTATGGATGDGTVFSVDPVTGAETVVYSFAGGQDGSGPVAALHRFDGVLYGTTRLGGASSVGTLFSFDPATGAEKVVFSFARKDGASPEAGLIDVGGLLYGTTTLGGTSSDGSVSHYGTVFSYDPAAGTERVLHSFKSGPRPDGAHPAAPLIEMRGLLYGAAADAVFSIDPATGAEKTFSRFDVFGTGLQSSSALISVGGTLYGTTSYGGIGHGAAGTVFAMTPATKKVQVVYVFGTGPDVSSNNLVNVSGTLFLTASAGGGSNIGDVVRIVPATGAASEVYAFPYSAAGANPVAPLISVGGNMLYGTTSSGGMFGGGTVFSLNPNTGAEAVLHSFGGGMDGSYPAGALLSVRGLLYGTTAYGGAHDSGTVFSISPAGGEGRDTVLHSFDPYYEGGDPESALINIAGRLYGTTFYGGVVGDGGTVFSMNPLNGAEKTLYTFNGTTDGANSAAPLLNVGGLVYGTTFRGMQLSSGGTVFSVNPATGAEKVIYDLGSYHCGAGLINVGGTLYGTAFSTQQVDAGKVFSFNLATGVEKDIYSFTGGSDGGSPSAALVRIGNKLYGTTSTGGAYGRGTVFELTP